MAVRGKTGLCGMGASGLVTCSIMADGVWASEDPGSILHQVSSPRSVTQVSVFSRSVIKLQRGRTCVLTGLAGNRARFDCAPPGTNSRTSLQDPCNVFLALEVSIHGLRLSHSPPHRGLDVQAPMPPACQSSRMRTMSSSDSGRYRTHASYSRSASTASGCQDVHPACAVQALMPPACPRTWMLTTWWSTHGRGWRIPRTCASCP